MACAFILPNQCVLSLFAYLIQQVISLLFSIVSLSLYGNQGSVSSHVTIDIRQGIGKRVNISEKAISGVSIGVVASLVAMNR